MYPKFKSAAAMQLLVDEYFTCTTLAGTTDNKQLAPPTFSGLALHLGYCCLEDFLKHEKTGPYKHVLRKAKLRIADSYEKKLQGPSATGAVFALKSMCWAPHSSADEVMAALLPKIKVEVINDGATPAFAERNVQL